MPGRRRAESETIWDFRLDLSGVMCKGAFSTDIQNLEVRVLERPYGPGSGQCGVLVLVSVV